MLLLINLFDLFFSLDFHLFDFLTFIFDKVPQEPKTQSGPRSGLFVVLLGKLNCVDEGAVMPIKVV